jgi:hypothetical protein
MWNMQTGRKVKALCSDGKVRTATFTAEADTFFTVPARVSVNGRTVTGHVTGYNEIFDPGVPVPAGTEYLFTAYQYRRNADALPVWPKATLRDI